MKLEIVDLKNEARKTKSASVVLIVLLLVVVVGFALKQNICNADHSVCCVCLYSDSPADDGRVLVLK